MLSHAAGVRSAGEDEFLEFLEDVRLDLTTVEGNALVELNDQVDASLTRFRGEIDAYEDEVLGRIAERCDHVTKGLVVKSEEEGARREKDGRERDLCERERQVRKREIEVCERERDVAQRERSVGKRENVVGNQVN